MYYWIGFVPKTELYFMHNQFNHLCYSNGCEVPNSYYRDKFDFEKVEPTKEKKKKKVLAVVRIRCPCVWAPS